MQEVVDTFPEKYTVKWNVGKLYKPKSQHIKKKAEQKSKQADIHINE